MQLQKLLHHPLDVLLGVVVGDAQQNHQAWADFTMHPSFNFDPGFAYSLDDYTHTLELGQAKDAKKSMGTTVLGAGKKIPGTQWPRVS